MKAERPGLTLVGHAARGVDHIKAVRPGGVGALGRIAEFVEHRGNLNSQLAHAGSRDEAALLFAARACEYDLVFYVALHLPDVAGMRLGNVDHEELNLVSILLVEFVEGRNLPPEGRSGVASEDEDNWSILGES